MISELSFLIDLLLNHKLPKMTKDIIADRIKEVEANRIPQQSKPVSQQLVGGVPQAPSTIAAMARHSEITPIIPPPEPIEPVTNIAQNPTTVAALISRNSAISDAISGKIDKTSGKPRKW